MSRLLFAAFSLCAMLMAAPLPVRGDPAIGEASPYNTFQLAQANPFPKPIGTPPPQKRDAPASGNVVGSIANVTAPASVVRGAASSQAKKGDEVRRGDRLQTGPGGALGVTFDDETTFSLTANAAITVDEFVYRKGAKGTATLTVARGTVGFVAAQVAKTGDMKINTPTAILGVRGTTGVVEVASGAATNVKLYPDANGAVGRIEIFGRDGARLAELTQAATGFALQLAAQRLSAVPLQITPEQLLRDRNLVQRVFNLQNIGRQLINQRLNIRNLDPRNIPGAPPVPTIPGLPSIPGLPRIP